MTRDEARSRVLGALGKVAPEIEGEDLRDDTDLRRDLELDSMDFLNVLIRIKKDLAVEVPEAEYAAVSTLGGLVAYVAEHA